MKNAGGLSACFSFVNNKTIQISHDFVNSLDVVSLSLPIRVIMTPADVLQRYYIHKQRSIKTYFYNFFFLRDVWGRDVIYVINTIPIIKESKLDIQSQKNWYKIKLNSL